MNEIPSFVECGGPCDEPFGWFVVERWEGGRIYARGHACGVGCLIATAHSQREGRISPAAFAKADTSFVISFCFPSDVPSESAPLYSSVRLSSSPRAM